MGLTLHLHITVQPSQFWKGYPYLSGFVLHPNNDGKPPLSTLTLIVWAKAELKILELKHTQPWVIVLQKPFASCLISVLP